MKKIFSIMSVVAMIGIAHAQTYQPFNPPGGLSVKTNIGTTTQTLLDITSRANNSVQLSQCPTTPIGAWMNTSTNIQQMLDATAYPTLTALHSTQFWLNSGAAQILAMGYSDMYHPIQGEDAAADVKKAISIINASGQPSIEIDLNPWMMPNVPVADYDYGPDGNLDSNAIFYFGNNGQATMPITGKKVTPLWNQGLHPTTVFMNTNFRDEVSQHDTANNSFHTEEFINDIETAATDVKTQMPSVRNVVIWQQAGYDSAHPSAYDPFDQFANDPYYARDRALALKLGAFGADIPASMMMAPSNGGQFLGGRSSPWLPDQFIRFWAGMFIWAKEHGVAVYLFSSPFQQDSSAPQYGYDTLFTQNTIAMARYLAAHSDGKVNALPNFWMVGQYSPNNTSNSLGNENDDNTVTHTMLELLEGPYSDKVNLSPAFAASVGVSTSSCAVGTGYNNIPSSLVTHGLVKGFASALPSYGGYEVKTVADDMKISNLNGLSFIDGLYLDTSLATAPPLLNVRGLYDGPSKSHGLLFKNFGFEEYADPYHMRIPYGNIVTGSYNSDGTPIIDTSSSTAINDRTEVTYSSGKFNWWFTWANNQILGASLAQDGMTIPVGLKTAGLTQTVTGATDGSTITQTATEDAAGNKVILQNGLVGVDYTDPVHSLYWGGKVTGQTFNGSPTFDPTTENYMTWGTWEDGAFDWRFSSGAGTWTAMELRTDRADFYVTVKPQGYPKAQLLTMLNSQEEGAIAYDVDDHFSVQKLCPTATTCAWYPFQYGTPLQ